MVYKLENIVFDEDIFDFSFYSNKDGNSLFNRTLINIRNVTDDDFVHFVNTADSDDIIILEFEGFYEVCFRSDELFGFEGFYRNFCDLVNSNRN